MILVDAIRDDAPPGTFVRLDGDEVAPAVAARLSLHQIGVADLLDGAHWRGRFPSTLVLLGLVPASVELGLGLSAGGGAATPGADRPGRRGGADARLSTCGLDFRMKRARILLAAALGLSGCRADPDRDLPAAYRTHESADRTPRTHPRRSSGGKRSISSTAPSATASARTGRACDARACPRTRATSRTSTGASGSLRAARSGSCERANRNTSDAVLARPRRRTTLGPDGLRALGRGRPAMTVSGRRIAVRGVVQGVGFRPWVWRVARESGVGGRVSNDAAGVTIEAFGAAAALEAFLSRLRQDPPPAAEIREMTESEIAAGDDDGLRHRREPSGRRSRRLDPAGSGDLRGLRARDLRPRATGVTGIPSPTAPTAGRASRSRARCPTTGRRRRWRPSGCAPPVRPSTTIRRTAAFMPSPTPARPAGRGSRRVGPGGDALGWPDPLAAAARALAGRAHRRDQGDRRLSPRLRRDLLGSPCGVCGERKRREEKPFAVMVRDLAAAERLAEIGAEERRLLLSPERPIVLALRAARIRGSPRRSLRRTARRPDARLHAAPPPPAGRHGPAARHDLRQPVGRADRLRPTPRRSRGSAGSPTRSWSTTARSSRAATTRSSASSPARPRSFRRSRGFVPRAVPVRKPFPEPVLACGAAPEEHVLHRRRRLGLPGSAHRGPGEPGDARGVRGGGRAHGAVPARLAGRRRARPASALHVDALRARAPGASRSASSTTTRTSSTRWRSTASRARSSAWPGTAPAGGPTARRGAARRCSSTQESFERLGTLPADARSPGGEAAIRAGLAPGPRALLDDAFDGDAPHRPAPAVPRRSPRASSRS